MQQNSNRRTRKALRAENTQLRAQLATHDHQTRAGLKSKLAAARAEVKNLRDEKSALELRLSRHEPQAVTA